MALPDENRITYFAETDARNKRVPFGIKAKDRTRHTYVIGKTGMGKSTMLENMAIQDIQNGEGFAFVDPHGKTAEYLLDFVPEHRIKDVLYFAPFDMEHPIGFNVMEDVGIDKRHLVVSGLMSAFKKIWEDAWSARMEYILQNTIQALLEYPGATMMGINKMLSDKEYRKKVVDNLKDPATKSFWVDEFAKYTERFAAEATPAIQNKVGQFTSNPLVRNIVGQPQSSFDLRQMMDQRKILIINLSKGRLGEGNANLLGSMLITKIYLAAMSRADRSERDMARLPNFYLYVDEFQSFANESFADILSEARKYKLNLTVAHQYIEQMSEEVRAAIFGNVGTMAVFRVGPFDAEIFEKEFMPTFVAEDFVNLGRYQMYLKLMIDGVGSQPFSAVGMAPIERPIISFKDKVIETSRQQYAIKRGEVEEGIVEQLSSTHKTEVRKDVLPERREYRREDQPIHPARNNYVSSGMPPGPPGNRETTELGKKSETIVEVGKHLDGLRRTLAGVLGETDLSGPKVSEPPKPTPPPEPIQRPVQNMAHTTPMQKIEHKPEEKKIFTPPTNSPVRPMQPINQKPNTNTANRAALQAVLSQLKEKEDGKTENGTAIKGPSSSHNLKPASTPLINNINGGTKLNTGEIPEKDLRAMLHVPESNNEKK